MGDVPAVGYRATGQARGLPCRRRRGGRAGDGRHEHHRRRQPACLAARGARRRDRRHPHSRKPLRRLALHQTRSGGDGRRHVRRAAAGHRGEGRCAWRRRGSSLLPHRVGLRPGPGQHRRTRRPIPFGRNEGRRQSRAAVGGHRHRRRRRLRPVLLLPLVGPAHLRRTRPRTRRSTRTHGDRRPALCGRTRERLSDARHHERLPPSSRRRRPRADHRRRHASGQTRCRRVVYDARRRSATGCRCAAGRGGISAAANAAAH